MGQLTPMASPAPTVRSEPAVRQHRFRAMNTNVHVIIVGGDDELPARAEAIVRDREARWSRFLPSSELSRLNAAPGRPVIVSPDTFALVGTTLEAYRLTDGVFDPTIFTSLVSAGYDRSFDSMEPLPTVDHVPAPTPAGIELHDGTNAIVLPAGVGLDLGGIAKGRTADTTVDELLERGADGCCVNIGGDLRAAGRPPGGRGWTVELECPGSVGVRYVTLSQGAVCTSTTTKRRWLTSRGEEHHLRDPSSGGSLNRGLRTVSVISASATQAEILTKVAFSAGIDGAEKAVSSHGATGLLVDDHGRVIELAGFASFALTDDDKALG